MFKDSDEEDETEPEEPSLLVQKSVPISDGDQVIGYSFLTEPAYSQNLAPMTVCALI